MCITSLTHMAYGSYRFLQSVPTSPYVDAMIGMQPGHVSYDTCPTWIYCITALHTWHIAAAVDFFNLLKPYHT